MQPCTPLADLIDASKTTALLHLHCALHGRVANKYCSHCQISICDDAACIDWHKQHGVVLDAQEVMQEQMIRLNVLGEQWSCTL